VDSTPEILAPLTTPETFRIPGRVGRDLVCGPSAQRVMGILNLTPDSFSDGGSYPDPEAAVAAALAMAADGADVLDLGAESSRPGADPVPAAVELSRLLPVLEALRPRTHLPISIDTTKAVVAAAALERGADWINDITALGADPDLARVVAGQGAAVVLMHMRGRPKTMQESPAYADPVAEVGHELQAAIERALAAGIGRERILIDPGLGFGKRPADSAALLRGLPALGRLGYPVVVGASRKSFLAALLAEPEPPPPAERDAATVAATAIAWSGGAALHRVHNVRYARHALRILDGIGRKGA
jgi:dihydropteroate synthase